MDPALMPRRSRKAGKSSSPRNMPAREVGGAAARIPSKEYFDFIRTPEWTALKKRVFDRAGGVCEKCHIGQAVHCDYVTVERFGGNERLEDLVAVCRMCHLNSQQWHPGKTRVKPGKHTEGGALKKYDQRLRKKKRNALGWVRTQRDERRAAVEQYCGEELAALVEQAFDWAHQRLEDMQIDSFSERTPLAVHCRDNLARCLVVHFGWREEQAVGAAELRIPVSKGSRSRALKSR